MDSNKYVMKKLICAAWLLGSMCVFSSCSDDSAFDKQEEYFENVGVHKIVVNLSGTPDIKYTASFVGGNIEGTRELFDADDNSQGHFYMKEGSVDDVQVVCYTDDQAISLALACTFISSVKGEVSYEIETYIKDKLIDTQNDKLIFNGDVAEGKQISITTNKN